MVFHSVHMAVPSGYERYEGDQVRLRLGEDVYIGI